MSLLRPSFAGQLARAGGYSARRVLPGSVRFESTTTTLGVPTTTTESGSPDTTLQEQTPGPRYVQPNYGAEVGEATSRFTPVPKRIQDGSEDVDHIPAAVMSGAPKELQARTVRIYKPAKTATQSGDWHGHHWRMDWDILPKGHRWENPLMGWQSSADFMQGTHMTFKTKDDAIHFAEKQGYEYFVAEPNVRKFVPKAYANNFLYTPGEVEAYQDKVRRIGTRSYLCACIESFMKSVHSKGSPRIEYVFTRNGRLCDRAGSEYLGMYSLGRVWWVYTGGNLFSPHFAV